MTRDFNGKKRQGRVLNAEQLIQSFLDFLRKFRKERV